MILAFSQKLNNKPTYFVEQINNCLFQNKIISIDEIDNYELDLAQKFCYSLKDIDQCKLHTIRKDTSNRWKAGNDIHFCINVRTKNQFQFAPIVKCVSTQKIFIDYNEASVDWFGLEPVVSIDDKILSEEEVEILAKNDGFDSVETFLEYFNTDFIGKIIHWTNLKY